MYCFLFVATGGPFMWKTLSHINSRERSALHTRYSCTSRAGEFDSHILGRMESSLKAQACAHCKILACLVPQRRKV